MGASNNNRFTATTSPKLDTNNQVVPPKLQKSQGNKVRKPIDLGAAASYAASQSSTTSTRRQQQQATATGNNKMGASSDFVNDLFSTGESDVVAQQPCSLVITGDDDDDFDLGPRAPAR